MKTRLFLYAIGLFSIFLLSACSGYRLDSGQYTMTLKLDDQEENLPKLVFLEKDGKKVTIKSQQETETLLGTLSGNELKITQSAAAKNITFLGKLTEDNRVEGVAKQTEGEIVDFSATFTLVKATE